MNAAEVNFVRAPSRKDQLIAQLVAQFHAVYLDRQTIDRAYETLNKEFEQSRIKREDLSETASKAFDLSQPSYQANADDPQARFVIDRAREYLKLNEF
jgi:hypothetical protein